MPEWGPARDEPRARVPSLSDRLAGLHVAIAEIETVLEGGENMKDGGTPTVTPLGLEATTTNLGDGLDKATGRIREIRARLQEHMRSLR